MERIELELINEICENQNFDELLLKIVHKRNRKNRINNLLNEIENNKTITRQLKMKLYEEIFEYVSDVNDYLKMFCSYRVFSISSHTLNIKKAHFALLI